MSESELKSVKYTIPYIYLHLSLLGAYAQPLWGTSRSINWGIDNITGGSTSPTPDNSHPGVELSLPFDRVSDSMNVLLDCILSLPHGLHSGVVVNFCLGERLPPPLYYSVPCPFPSPPSNSSLLLSPIPLLLVFPFPSSLPESTRS